jgi:uncharacterized membrane protein
VIYYFTHVEVYYRRQIDPLMVILSVYGVMGFAGSRKRTIAIDSSLA